MASKVKTTQRPKIATPLKATKIVQPRGTTMKAKTARGKKTM